MVPYELTGNRRMLVVRWMASARLRQILRRAEFNGDVLLNRDGPFVQESGLVTPQANGVHRSGKKGSRAAQELDIQHLAQLSDRGADPNDFCCSIAIPLPRVAGPDEGDKLAGLQSGRFISRLRSGIRRNQNG